MHACMHECIQECMKDVLSTESDWEILASILSRNNVAGLPAFLALHCVAMYDWSGPKLEKHVF